ncbi:hypothetical protein CTI12_AA584760 [Artemisia annua]|uniref:HTH La-type RNA-binding domain-containing protein n=1 Tax=Artemisia annua TaxID=35608 RepID=A0A2U1KN64_ARTAN|nr:hypothetical protein CTI12_AA584760 [Artemisia annua]
MGADLWPDLSESTRPVSKAEQYSKLVNVAPVISQTQPKPSKSNANSHSNTNNNHRRAKRGGNAGGAPAADMTYCNYGPPMLDSPVREQQPPLKGNGNGWIPRPMGGNARRNNFGPRPNGYTGRSPRGPPLHQIAPPPPPPRGYFRPPHMGPPPYMSPLPIRPYGTPMGYEMAPPVVYFNTLPMEPYMNTPLPPQAAPRPMFMDHPLHVKILSQIEYYFSDANLVKDNFLRSNMDEEGWVPIDLIANFRRVTSLQHLNYSEIGIRCLMHWSGSFFIALMVKDLTTDVEKILDSLKNSSSVEIQGDKVRRRNEWRKWLQIADSSSIQSPPEAKNDLPEETSMHRLTLVEVTTKEHINLDAVDNDDHKEDQELTFSSKLASEVTSRIKEHEILKKDAGSMSVEELVAWAEEEARTPYLAGKILFSEEFDVPGQTVVDNSLVENILADTNTIADNNDLGDSNVVDKTHFKNADKGKGLSIDKQVLLKHKTLDKGKGKLVEGDTKVTKKRKVISTAKGVVTKDNENPSMDSDRSNDIETKHGYANFTASNADREDSDRSYDCLSDCDDEVIQLRKRRKETKKIKAENDAPNVPSEPVTTSKPKRIFDLGESEVLIEHEEYMEALMRKLKAPGCRLPFYHC